MWVPEVILRCIPHWESCCLCGLPSPKQNLSHLLLFLVRSAFNNCRHLSTRASDIVWVLAKCYHICSPQPASATVIPHMRYRTQGPGMLSNLPHVIQARCSTIGIWSQTLRTQSCFSQPQWMTDSQLMNTLQQSSWLSTPALLPQSSLWLLMPPHCHFTMQQSAGQCSEASLLSCWLHYMLIT